MVVKLQKKDVGRGSFQYMITIPKAIGTALESRYGMCELDVVPTDDGLLLTISINGHEGEGLPDWLQPVTPTPRGRRKKV